MNEQNVFEQNDTDYFSHHLTRGIELQQNGQLNDAKHAYLRAIECHPQHPVANNNLGFIYAQQQQCQQAIEHFEIAISSDPNSYMAHTNLGQVLVLTGATETGLAHLYKAIEINSESLQSLDTLASMLQWLGQLPQAQSYWQQAQNLSANDPQYALKTALCIALQNNHSEAILRYQDILKNHPKTQQAWTYLGISYLVSQYSQNPEHALLKAIQLDSTDTNALKHLALLKLAVNQLEQGIDYYQQLLSIEPDNHTCRLDMAITLLATGNGALALTHIERLLDANQSHAKVIYYRALCLRQLNLVDKADVILTKLAQGECEFSFKARELLTAQSETV